MSVGIEDPSERGEGNSDAMVFFKQLLKVREVAESECLVLPQGEDVLYKQGVSTLGRGPARVAMNAGLRGSAGPMSGGVKDSLAGSWGEIITGRLHSVPSRLDTALNG